MIGLANQETKTNLLGDTRERLKIRLKFGIGAQQQEPVVKLV